MARRNSTRMRSHPTAAIGMAASETSSSHLPAVRKQKVMSEVNTVHAFGNQGQETSGWPFHGYGQVGTLIGPYLYRAPRASQNDLGGKTRKRKHPTQSIGV